MRRSAIFAITAVVCACTSWAQSLTEAREHSALAIKLFRQAKFAEAEREYRSRSRLYSAPGQSRDCRSIRSYSRTWPPSCIRRANQGSAAGPRRMRVFGRALSSRAARDNTRARVE